MEASSANNSPSPNRDKSEIRGTAKVTKEMLKVDGVDMDCERKDIEAVMTNPTWKTYRKDHPLLEMKVKTSTWVSDKVPFRSISVDGSPGNPEDKLTWEGKCTVKGGVVRFVRESGTSKHTITLVGWGTDAKGTLQK